MRTIEEIANELKHSCIGREEIDRLADEILEIHKAEQMVNGFTGFMKDFWNNPNLKVPGIDELIEAESEE